MSSIATLEALIDMSAADNNINQVSVLEKGVSMADIMAPQLVELVTPRTKRVAILKDAGGVTVQCLRESLSLPAGRLSRNYQMLMAAPMEFLLAHGLINWEPKDLVRACTLHGARHVAIKCARESLSLPKGDLSLEEYEALLSSSLSEFPPVMDYALRRQLAGGAQPEEPSLTAPSYEAERDDAVVSSCSSCCGSPCSSSSGSYRTITTTATTTSSPVTCSPANSFLERSQLDLDEPCAAPSAESEEGPRCSGRSSPVTSPQATCTPRVCARGKTSVAVRESLTLAAGHLPLEFEALMAADMEDLEAHDLID